MSGWRPMAWAVCGLAAMWAAAGMAQTMPGGEKSVVKGPAWTQKEVSFSEAKVVLGLQLDATIPSATRCSTTGEIFLETHNLDPNGVLPDVTRVNLSGDVKHFLRKMPPREDDVPLVDDFYVAEKNLVSLLRIENDDKRPAEIRYFLSVSDHDGDGQKLLPLDVKFKPLKIAMFGDGSFLLLGFDELNLLPVLALLKDDGTLRRFIDLDNRVSTGGLDALSMKGAMKPETVELLQRARFSAFGKDVLLAQPGTAAPVHDLSPIGEDRRIPVSYPAGWVMHDVLAGPAQWTMVVRMQPQAREKNEPPGNYERLFEVDATHGSLVRELTFQTPSVTDVTCAPAGKIAAMYRRQAPGTSQPGDGADGKKSEPPKLELVVGTAMR